MFLGKEVPLLQLEISRERFSLVLPESLVLYSLPITDAETVELGKYSFRGTMAWVGV